MASIKIRGGSFSHDASCAFDDDHFTFSHGASLFSADVTKVHVREVRAARVIESTTTSLSFKNAAGAAGAGVLAGFWFGPPGALAGAVIGTVLGINSGSTPSEVTFEAQFNDNRTMVGTISVTGWDELLRAWHISQRPAALAGNIQREAAPREESVAIRGPADAKEKRKRTWWPKKG